MTMIRVISAAIPTLTVGSAYAHKGMHGPAPSLMPTRVASCRCRSTPRI